MARIKGDKPYGLQFESTVQADLDARKEIPLLADLTSANTWTALNGAPNHYVGMTTFCLENKTRYELLGDDPTDINNWRATGSSELQKKPDVVEINGFFESAADKSGAIAEMLIAPLRSYFRKALILYDSSIRYFSLCEYQESKNNNYIFTFTHLLEGGLNTLVVEFPVSSGSGTYTNTPVSESSTVYDFKASDYVTDKSNATAGLQALFDAVAKSELQIPNVLIEAGEYITNDIITCNKSFNLEASGAIINASSSTRVFDGNQFYGFFQLGGRDNVQLSLGYQIGLNSVRINLNDTSLVQKGDIIILQDTTPNSFAVGVDAYESQMVLVTDVDADFAYTDARIKHTYTVENTNLFRIRPNTYNINGLEVIGYDGNTEKSIYTILISNAINSTFTNIKASGSNWTNFGLENSMNCSLDNIFIDYPSIVSHGLNYGIEIMACEKIIISKSFLKTTRHSLTITGSASVRTCVSRFITVDDCVLESYGGQDSPAFDTHEATQHIIVTNSQILGGVGVRGKDVLIDTNYIACSFEDIIISLTGLAGGRFTVKNNIIENFRTAAFPVIAILNSSGNAVNQSEVLIDSNLYIGNSAATEANQISFVQCNITAVDGVEPVSVTLNNNRVWHGSQQILFNGQSSIKHIAITNNKTDGVIRLNSNVVNLETIIVKGNTFKGENNEVLNYNIIQQGFNAVVNNAYYEISNNEFNNFSINPIFFINYAGNPILRNNKFLKSSGSYGMLRFTKDTSESQAISSTLTLFDNYLEVANAATVNWLYQARHCSIVSNRNTANEPLEISRFDADSTITNPNILTTKPSEQEERCNGTMIFVDGIPQWWDATKAAWVDATGTDISIKKIYTQTEWDALTTEQQEAIPTAKVVED